MKDDEVLIQYRMEQVKERQVSDYQVIETVTSEDAETALKRAEGFVEAVGGPLEPRKQLGWYELGTLSQA